ncbi:MAG: LytR C-terminal domain-containing protein [Candidatus Ancillula sp.]|jgi:hypothetical protein|nr:LytR C-terminal domain-containing protein [Candidatus Ancillula sp.]
MSDNNNRKKIDELKITYKRERKNLGWTVLVSFFTVVFLIALFFFVSVMFPSSSTVTSSNEQSQYKLPCLEKNVAPVDPSGISLRVLNGSGKAGFATAVSDALNMRGFSITSVDTAPFNTSDTQIRYGSSAIRQAYTLAQYFPNVTMILDDRQDGLIDVIIGGSFTELNKEDLIATSDGSQMLASPKGCVNVVDIKPAVALSHDTTLVPAYKDNDDTTDGTETE